MAMNTLRQECNLRTIRCVHVTTKNVTYPSTIRHAAMQYAYITTASHVCVCRHAWWHRDAPQPPRVRSCAPQKSRVQASQGKVSELTSSTATVGNPEGSTPWTRRPSRVRRKRRRHRKKPASPKLTASCSACTLQLRTRLSNWARRSLKFFGGPRFRKVTSGARNKIKSSSLVARETMTYRCNHQSSSSMGCAPPSRRPQSTTIPPCNVSP